MRVEGAGFRVEGAGLRVQGTFESNGGTPRSQMKKGRGGRGGGGSNIRRLDLVVIGIAGAARRVRLSYRLVLPRVLR